MPSLQNLFVDNFKLVDSGVEWIDEHGGIFAPLVRPARRWIVG
jgi:hypothetical protein